MKMNQFKKELLMREFPFLSDGEGNWDNFVGWWEPDEVRIKRVDNDVLNLTPSYTSYSWRGGDKHDYDKFFVIIDGAPTGLNSAGLHETGSGERYETTADTVGGQIRSLGINNYEYLVRVEFSDTDANGNGQEYKVLTIYKTKGGEQTAFEKAQLIKAYKALMEEIERADSQ